MPENYLEVGKPIEDARQHQTDELHARIIVPAQAILGQGVVDLRAEPRIVNLAHRRIRRTRVKQDGYAERGGRFEDGHKARIVQVSIAHAPAQHQPLDAERLHTALEFASTFVGKCHRQGRQCLETIGVPLDRSRCDVVGPTRHIDTHDPEIMHCRRRHGQYLHIESGLVHQGNTPIRQIEHPPAGSAGD